MEKDIPGNTDRCPCFPTIAHQLCTYRSLGRHAASPKVGFSGAKIVSFCINKQKVCKEKAESPKNTPKPTKYPHDCRLSQILLQTVIKRFFHNIYLRLELG